MNNEEFYKKLYEASEKEKEESRKKFFQYVLDTLFPKLGTSNYYDFIRFVVISEMKNIVEYLESDQDRFETPDNKAQDLSAAYRMVEYFSTAEYYEAYVKGRRDV